MKLSAAQERMLIELAEPNGNDENEWRIGNSGQVRTCKSLVRLGLAKRHSGECWASVFSLTDAGKAKAKSLTNGN